MALEKGQYIGDKKGVEGKVIYLDNAATSFPKPLEVGEAISECLKNWCANPGRSGHKNAMRSSETVYRTREKTGKLTGFNPNELIFTSNCTSALNQGIKGILKEGDHVVSTVFEHNSVLRTLNALKIKGVSATLAGCDNKGMVSAESIKRAINKNTRMIICTLSSNVTGNIMPVVEISRIAKEKGILFLLDGSQGLGSIPIDLDEIRPDILCCSGHKSLMGPQGTGILCIRKEIDILPLIHGGTGTDSKKMVQPQDRPEGFEAGTLNVPGIAGLSAAVDYIQQRGIDEIRLYETDLMNYLQDEIKNVKNIKKYGVCDPKKRSSILAFNIQGIDSERVAEELDIKYGIAVRAGYHCAPFAHMAIGTEESGCVRISVGPFNTYEEIKYTAEAIKQIAEKH